MIVTRSNFAEVVSHLEKPGQYGGDSETTGLQVWLTHRMFSWIIADENESFYFNFQKYKGLDSEKVLPRPWFKKLAGIYSNPDSLHFFHNAKFDMAAAAQDGLLIRGPVHCTEACGRVAYNALFNYQLETLVKPLGIEKSLAVDEYIEKHELYTRVLNAKGKFDKIPHYDRVPFEVISEYGMQDGRIVRTLGLEQISAIDALSARVQAGKATPINILNNERRLTHTCFRMEQAGIKIDRVAAAKGAEYERKRIAATASEFKRLTGHEFVDSAKALVPAFDKLGCKYPLTAKGNPSFTDEVLEEFNNPVAQLVRDYRSSNKRLNTYYMNFLKYADAHDLVHAVIRQGGTTTGRMSYADPNLQNLPKRKEEKGEFKIRGCVIPEPGQCLVMLDYDQMEYRLMLEYAKEMGVIEQVLGGLDVHEATARMMGVDRDPAKTLNFMLLYGGGVAKLCAALFKPTLELAVLKALVNIHLWGRAKPGNRALVADLPQGVVEWNVAELVKALELQELYFAKLPRVRKFTKGVTEVAEKRGYVRNWAGRVCHYPNSSHAYAAPNHLIQGGCGDVVKIAMNRLDDFMRGRKSKMLVQVHDELLFSMHPSEFGLVPEIKNIMETVYPHTHLPLTCGVDHSWKSWADKVEGLPK